MSGEYVLICRGDALGGMTDNGKYLVAFDADADDGIGLVCWGDLDEAMRFDSVVEAVTLWHTQSTVRPLRNDGLANRPLTAWHTEPWKEGS